MCPDPPAEATTALELVAYRLTEGAAMPIVPVSADRAWMDETTARNAYRCLPMLIANQSGGLLLNTQPLTVTWNGGPAAADLTIELHGDDGGTLLYPPKSHFGHGILSWSIPYIFRTPPAYNLLARGPANLPKDGVSPLEGLVETDWTDGFFAMNWKLTRPNVPITFERDEPICLLVPMRRGSSKRSGRGFSRSRATPRWRAATTPGARAAGSTSSSAPGSIPARSTTPGSPTTSEVSAETASRPVTSDPARAAPLPGDRGERHA